MARGLERIFSELFSALALKGYCWEPATPDRLQRLRKDPGNYGALERFFGLGLEVQAAELSEQGFSPELVAEVARLRPAITRFGDFFIPHDHLARAPGEIVYLSAESLELARILGEKRERIRDRAVLDLGSGAGLLSFALAREAGRVLGLENSSKAVDWARAAAQAQGVRNVSFSRAEIGSIEADSTVAGTRWDVAVFNPPMAVPVSGSPRPHRDGGALGVELPLKFLEFAGRWLPSGGEVFCLTTNPIVRGRPLFFDRIGKARWEILERRCLNENFNRSLHVQDGYPQLGIERVELWFLHLQSRGAMK